MKAKKNYFVEKFADDEDDHDGRRQNKRRPIRNWTKAWVEHEPEAEIFDDFYNRR